MMGWVFCFSIGIGFLIVFIRYSWDMGKLGMSFCRVLVLGWLMLKFWLKCMEVGWSWKVFLEKVVGLLFGCCWMYKV